MDQLSFERTLDDERKSDEAMAVDGDPSGDVLMVTNELVNAAELNSLMEVAGSHEDSQTNDLESEQNAGSLGLNDAHLDQCDDSNLQEDVDADISFKQDLLEDTLALSPTGGLSSGSFILNGSNVSTHTFRKTEWDVKKLENYVRQSYGDITPMENMEPAQMNTYLKSFFELAKKSDGMEYEPESLIGFMNSFERYLKTKNYAESLLRSETFKEARTILKKKTRPSPLHRQTNPHQDQRHLLLASISPQFTQRKRPAQPRQPRLSSRRNLSEQHDLLWRVFERGQSVARQPELGVGRHAAGTGRSQRSRVLDLGHLCQKDDAPSAHFARAAAHNPSHQNGHTDQQVESGGRCGRVQRHWHRAKLSAGVHASTAALLSH